jgi:hypothetical protein
MKGVKAKKSYKHGGKMKNGGKVVAQGADKKDVRRERKMERIMKRKKS